MENRQYAERNQSRHDIHWSWHHDGKLRGSEYHFERITWSGYDDSYWWNNVATSDRSMTRTCSCGKEFVLDPSTGEVRERVENYVPR